ncbi:Protein phosphatase 2A, regulatory subunit PR55 [Cynara cardunculus var. scolymus]|uniref:Serine/threonine-protein phosphatase 2A 55 kDa regulatory subunit B n=1 Tax=Cynara cardunculus var. scolymus TaxID=59895 RepID=A0A103XFT8_CYNCS|nr:Protein phosphatase 2A, regulatory subunit PR55 [Cynara cardunculus var. scolymus]
MEGEDDVHMATEGLDWKFSQVFGEPAAGEEVQEVDIISAIEFDKSGDHLATGDCGGRVVLFERINKTDHADHRRDLDGMDCSSSRRPEYRYKTEFQSHEPEFDYLKSLEIEEKINHIRWCHTANGAMFLLSTNDKTIKCWKVQEKKIKKICHMNIEPPKPTSNGFVSGSNVPTMSKPHTANGDGIDKHLRCMSDNVPFPSDGETFISGDDLRINLWNMEISNQSFNIVDVKPANMEDLTEVITSAEFHPSHCHMLAYSSSKGSIRLLDLRQSALCDGHSKLLKEHEAPGARSFFTDIIASISDIKFSKGGRHILSRDYMTLKLWDINMDSVPVATFQVHEYLRPKLCDMYENDSIFDKFECCLSGDGQRVATGSYSNLFRVFGCSEGSSEEATLEATKNPTRRQIQTPPRFPRSLGTLPRVSRRGMFDLATGFYADSAPILSYDLKGSDNLGIDINGSSYDFSRKLLHLAWHPNENSIVCAASNSLYMYYA